MRKPAATWLFLVLASFASAVPGVLIAQQDVTKAARADIVKRIINHDPKRDWEPGLIDASVATMLAAYLDKDGRVFPIVWSLTDSIFRAAIEEGKVKGETDNPSLASVMDVRPKLRCDYAILVTAWREGDEILASLRLFSGRRETWRDDRSVSALKSGVFDSDTAVESLASTWTQLLASGPLKALPQQRVRPQQDPESGQKPPNQDNPNAGGTKPPPNNDAVELAMKKLAAGQPYAAINLLRDAVDAEPLEPERRRLLVNVLQQIPDYRLAAEEARRAAGLFPAKPEFRVMAARAWLQANEPDRALEDLNEAVARDPDAYDTRLLLGELQLNQLRLEFAREHFDRAIEKNPTSEALYARGIARLLLGDKEGGLADWAAANKVQPASIPDAHLNRYRLSSRTLRTFGETLATEIGRVLTVARSNAKEPGSIAAVATVSRKAGFAIGFLEALIAPASHQRSHQRLALALKLLSQSTSEAQALLKDPTDDNLAEASITLGEALKQLKDAKDAFDSERAGQPTVG